jgi:hypothetical protein
MAVKQFKPDSNGIILNIIDTICEISELLDTNITWI